MDEFIRLSGEELVKRLSYTSVLTALWTRGMITMDQYEEVGDLSTHVNRTKLLKILQNVDDSWVDVFIEIVEEKIRGNQTLIDHLKENREKVNSKRGQPATNQSSLLGNAVKPGSRHDTEQLTGSRIPVSPVPKPATIPGALLEKYTPGRASSSKTDSLPFPSMVYEPKHNTKGHVLIMNNISFDDDVDGTLERKGAAVDTERLVNLFYGFDMNVYPAQNVTRTKFHLVLNEFKNKFKSEPADACVVVIMSHGDYRDRIYTSDHEQLQIHGDILQQFNNENFEEMIGRPKIFFFQSCRGEKTDGGRTVQKDSPPILPSNLVRIPTWGDILVCYSTLEGHYAYRDTVTGSWFMEIVCDVFTKYAKHLDVCRMLNIVAEKMKEKETEEGNKQTCPWTNIGFTKEFYFVPKQNA